MKKIIVLTLTLTLILTLFLTTKKTYAYTEEYLLDDFDAPTVTENDYSMLIDLSSYNSFINDYNNVFSTILTTSFDYHYRFPDENGIYIIFPETLTVTYYIDSLDTVYTVILALNEEESTNNEQLYIDARPQSWDSGSLDYLKNTYINCVYHLNIKGNEKDQANIDFLVNFVNPYNAEQVTYTGSVLHSDVWVTKDSELYHDSSRFELEFYHSNIMYQAYLIEQAQIIPPTPSEPSEPSYTYDSLMTSIFGGFASILSVEVFPNITIGLIIGLPLLLGALLIILKFIRG